MRGTVGNIITDSDPYFHATHCSKAAISLPLMRSKGFCLLCRISSRSRSTFQTYVFPYSPYRAATTSCKVGTCSSGYLSGCTSCVYSVSFKDSISFKSLVETNCIILSGLSLVLLAIEGKS
jgi:hypothetical protein